MRMLFKVHKMCENKIFIISLYDCHQLVMRNLKTDKDGCSLYFVFTKSDGQTDIALYKGCGKKLPSDNEFHDMLA